MARINDRGAMRKRIEEETMTHIARYIAKRPDLTVDKLFDRFETDENGFIDIDELTAMFKELEINVNNQLLRILLSIFDRNGDQAIQKDEFKELLDKYCTKKAIGVADIQNKVIGTEDAKQLVEMYNEDIRDKQVYENFEFDYENLAAIKQREAQAL